MYRLHSNRAKYMVNWPNCTDLSSKGTNTLIYNNKYLSKVSTAAESAPQLNTAYHAVAGGCFLRKYIYAYIDTYVYLSPSGARRRFYIHILYTENIILCEHTADSSTANNHPNLMKKTAGKRAPTKRTVGVLKSCRTGRFDEEFMKKRRKREKKERKSREKESKCKERSEHSV